MLFNSLPFFGFLMLTLASLGLAQRLRCAREQRILLLGLASLAFYANWDLRLAGLLSGSIATNYLLGRLVLGGRGRLVLGLGIAFNLLLIGVFKYADFTIDGLNAVLGTGLPPAEVALPLGISFYTFEQIAYLVTLRQGGAAARRGGAGEYLLFVTFFPHLIAGPIIQPQAFFRQTVAKGAIGIALPSLAAGFALFVVGLGKKVLIADNLAPHVGAVFEQAAALHAVSFTDAWCGALLYTFQIYFDFSGYSDMAVGLALMFGIVLPFNFDSPYRADSIVDFWRRWHMSLSRFLRDYLYIPLGGNRLGFARQLVNIMIVMLIGGLWHGAGWTFVAWGAGHGLLIVADHLWRRLVPRRREPGPLRRWSARLLTFMCVVLLWTVFRAGSFEAAWAMYGGMLGLNGLLPPSYLPAPLSRFATAMPSIYDAQGVVRFAAVGALLYSVCLFAPNSQRIVLGADGQAPIWRATPAWGVAVGLLGLAALVSIYVGRPSEFLYFQF